MNGARLILFIDISVMIPVILMIFISILTSVIAGFYGLYITAAGAKALMFIIFVICLAVALVFDIRINNINGASN